MSLSYLCGISVSWIGLQGYLTSQLPPCVMDLDISELLTFSCFAVLVSSLLSNGKPLTQRRFVVPGGGWWHCHWFCWLLEDSVWERLPFSAVGVSVSWTWRGSCRQVGLQSQNEQDGSQRPGCLRHEPCCAHLAGSGRVLCSAQLEGPVQSLVVPTWQALGENPVSRRHLEKGEFTVVHY